MKKLLCLVALAVSVSSFGASLDFLKNGESIKNIGMASFEKGKLAKVSSESKNIYNAWRKYRKTYVGYDFFKVLDAIYGADWRSAKKITFVALDGYRQTASIKKMIAAASGKTGLIAFKEKGKQGFSTFKRKEKTVDPGPFYLVWSNFVDGDKAKHGDTLKWPYQLKSINIVFN